MPELTQYDSSPLSGFRQPPNIPLPGSEAEKIIFSNLQQNFAAQFEHAFPNPLSHKAVVIIPSLTLDQEILQKIDGVVHYEERLLCLLMLLRMPRTHIIFVTSVPIDPVIIDYYLHLLPGITGYHARQRLTLLSCFDASPNSLTEKILARPRLIERIRQSIPPQHLAHLAFFNVTSHERSLAVQLHMPIYGCDPDLYHIGNKSNSRMIFKECGLLVPDGEENLKNEWDIAVALSSLKQRNPELKKAVVKMNDGFSGEGNAIYYYDNTLPHTHFTGEFIVDHLSSNLKIVAANLSYETFMQKFKEGQGIVEAFIEGNEKSSPSVQCRITPLGRCEVVSTHDQLLGGEGGQVFLGAHFPAKSDYAPEIGEAGLAVGKALQTMGALGRFGIDFISVHDPGGWKHYAIEINLRKGGTTHPYLMLDYLTQGDYNAETGIYQMANGQPRYYFSSDNLRDSCYHGLTPHDLIDIAMIHELRYDGSTQEGVVFHLIGALSQFGKLGVVCIGATPQKAERLFEKTCEVLKTECG